jgi:hypothetical protein
MARWSIFELCGPGCMGLVVGTTGKSWTALKDLVVKTTGDFESRTLA